MGGWVSMGGMEAAEKVETFMRFMEVESAKSVQKILRRIGKQHGDVRGSLGSELVAGANLVRGGATIALMPSLTDAKLAAMGRDGTPNISEQRKSLLLPVASTAGRKSSREVVLDDVFQSYADPAYQEIQGSGFARFIQDLRILDNKFRFGDIAVVFATYEQSLSVRDNRMNPVEWRKAIHEVAMRKFPQCATQAEAFDLLFEKHIEPYAKRNARTNAGLDPLKEQLDDPALWAVFDRHEGAFKQIFLHYCTLGGSKKAMARSWHNAEKFNASMDLEEWVCLLMNIGVVPGLLSKLQCIDAFVRANTGDVADDDESEMSFPEFIEAVGRIALMSIEAAERKLVSKYSNLTETAPAKRLLALVPDRWRSHYEDTIMRRFEKIKFTKIDWDARQKTLQAEVEANKSAFEKMKRDRITFQRTINLDSMRAKRASDYDLYRRSKLAVVGEDVDDVAKFELEQGLRAVRTMPRLRKSRLERKGTLDNGADPLRVPGTSVGLRAFIKADDLNRDRLNVDGLRQGDVVKDLGAFNESLTKKVWQRKDQEMCRWQLPEPRYSKEVFGHDSGTLDGPLVRTGAKI